MPPHAIRGVIAVSGAGFDLSDQETYRLFGGTQASVAKRLGIEISPQRAREASPVNYLDKDDPPFLLVSERRQTRHPAASHPDAGGTITFMSRPDRAPGLIVLRYLDQLRRHPR